MPGLARRRVVGEGQVRAAGRLDHLLAQRVDGADSAGPPSRRRTARCRRRRCWPARTRRPPFAWRRRSRDDPLEQRQRIVDGASGRPARAPGRSGSPGRGRSSPRSRRTASSRSGRRAPRAGGRRWSGRRGTSAAAGRRRSSRRRGAGGAPRRSGCRAIFSSRAPRSRRRVSYSSRMPAANSHAPVDVDERRRDADRSRGIGDVHDRRRGTAGSILTAVWVRDVVAPPMSSGSSKPSRSISPATWRISSSDGVMSPDSPIRSASTSRAVSRIRCDRDHDAEVDDLVVVAGEHDADDVLADVVDVALDRGHDDPAVRSAPRRAGARPR